ncbi:Gar1/Naf1 RNA binding region-domain-containing protein [Pyronema omphalodes]|nr:Gar1/Naf1 RNA binding region-domain-containing protein [Pyronema omphalodes]
MEHETSASDLEPLAKRVRLDTNDTNAISVDSHITGVLEEGDDADSDFYGDEQSPEPVKVSNGVQHASVDMSANQAVPASTGGIPGLLMAEPQDNNEVSRQLDMEHSVSENVVPDEPKDTIPPATLEPATTTEAAETGNVSFGEDVAMKAPEFISEAMHIENETSTDQPVKSDDMEDQDLKSKEAATASANDDDVEDITREAQGEAVDPTWIAEMLTRNSEKRKNKPTPDAEFLELAEAQKGDDNAEWRYDTSDAESSSSESDPEPDSGDNEEDSDEEDGFGRMAPEEIAKALMEVDYDEMDAKGEVLRTKNEVPEEELEVERPDITVTPETRIEELGKVESIVNKMVLIASTRSGDVQVLGEKSPLVTADRVLFGTVADTLGRVEEPLYTVRFNSSEEIKEFGLEEGTKVFYLPDFAEYVFTQPLMQQKGTDASNIYDEEAAASEQEFSDDEAEAAYKKRKKQARKDAAAAKNPKKQDTKPTPSWAQSEPAPSAGPATLSYDEPYVPLQRPTNLHEMFDQPPPPPPSSMRGGRGGRGGKGDRGNFRGGRGNDRGGRGGGERGGNQNNRGRDRDNNNNNRGRGNDRGNRGNDRGGRGSGDRGGRGNFNDRQNHKGGRGGQQGHDRDHSNNRNRSPRATRDQNKRERDSSPGNYNQGQQNHNQNQKQQSQQNQNAQYQQTVPIPQVMPQFPGFPPIPSIPQASNGQQGWPQQPVSYPQFQFPLPFTFPGMPPMPPMPQAGAHVNPSFFGQQQPAQQQQAVPQIPAWMAAFAQAAQPQQQYQAPQASQDDAFKALQNTLAMLKGQQQNHQQPPQ